MTDFRHTVLTIGHGHPEFSPGGGEIAAYNLFRQYKEHPNVDGSYFLARHETTGTDSGEIRVFRDNELLWHSDVANWFRMTARSPYSAERSLSELLRAIRPSIVHVHHYVHLGLEFLAFIKKVDPQIVLMMTLHEYGAICLNDGQMVKTGSKKLCFQSNPLACNQCFSNRTPEDFWLRKHRFQSYFRYVDHFVAPSDFLRQRYIDWGLPSEKVHVIENAQPEREPLPPRPLGEGESRNRFAYFGQITPYKGLDVVLEGLNMLPKKERSRIVLEVHGSNLENQTHDFQEKIARLRKPLEKEGVLQWMGSYDSSQLPARMATIDWVIVPSVWWENSPMVIQEALGLGRPVICSNIGGMAEKVENGVTGLHLPVGSARGWAEGLIAVSKKVGEWSVLKTLSGRRRHYGEVAGNHLNLISPNLIADKGLDQRVLKQNSTSGTGGNLDILASAYFVHQGFERLAGEEVKVRSLGDVSVLIEKIRTHHDFQTEEKKLLRFGLESGAYWSNFLEGVLSFSQRGYCDDSNPFLRLLNRQLSTLDPSLARHLGGNLEGYRDLVVRRFSDFFELMSGSAQKVSPIRIFNSESDARTLYILRTDSGEEITVGALDGHHRLFSARVTGIQHLRYQREDAV